jgi:D-alanyl-D-alanine carboxypeptidase (penicillin-binding protein 5/6)
MARFRAPSSPRSRVLSPSCALAAILVCAGSFPAAVEAATAALPRVSKDPYLGAIVLEVPSGRTLFADGADRKGYPASLVKMMGFLLALEKIEAGTLRLDESVSVPAEATAVDGSKAPLTAGDSLSLEDLLYALMVRSANDAAVTLAIHIAGTERAFIALMNERARELGLTATTFRSVHGLPPAAGGKPDETTARDMAKLSLALLARAETARYTSVARKTLLTRAGRKLEIRGHHPLLGKFEGCDGLKTGYIRAAGFSVSASARRGSKRYVAVVFDSLTKASRDSRARDLLTRAFDGRLAKAKPSIQAKTAVKATAKPKAKAAAPRTASKSSSKAKTAAKAKKPATKAPAAKKTSKSK